MEPIILFGIAIIVSSIILGVGAVASMFVYMQMTVYKQAQLNYRTALKTQNTGGVVPHSGSDGGIFGEIAPYLQLLQKPEVQEIVKQFLANKVQQNTGVTNGEKVQ